MTGSWDGTVAMWDPLMKLAGRPTGQASLRKTLPANTKVYSLDILGGTYGTLSYDFLEQFSQQQILFKLLYMIFEGWTRL